MSLIEKIAGSYTKKHKEKFKSMAALAKQIEEQLSASITTSQKKHKVTIKNPDGTTEVRIMTDEEIIFFKKTNQFKARLRNGEKLEDIMPEALALCSEAVKRVTAKQDPNGRGKDPYAEQIEAAIGMQDNNISQMATGEGKSLVQILSSYLNALEATKDVDKNNWQSIHVMTSNPYLAFRDFEDNKQIFNLLGLSVGYAMDQGEMGHKGDREKKKQAYKCDIVYGTAKTIAFDYLDDNCAMNPEDRFITKKGYRAIVDEADDILLDQGIIPLILSRGATAEESKRTIDLYEWATQFVNGSKGFRNNKISCKVFDQFEKHKSDPWTEECCIYEDQNYVYFSERLTNELYDMFPEATTVEMAERIKAVEQCLLAAHVYKEGIQYQVEPDKNPKSNGNYIVVLVDHSTGRKMAQSKFQGGLQQAIEAKEKLRIDREKKPRDKRTLIYSKINRVIGKCTYPDFLSTYSNGVCGMTGTSDIEEFREIYSMDTYEVDKRKKSQRQDFEDELYLTEDAKFEAIAKEILACQKTGQPMLIGTTSVSESDRLCKKLASFGIKGYRRLDAVNSTNEDDIVKNAGRLGAITIATNMAGRGTDIPVEDAALRAGGLYVIGTSKNKNSRIDNQLRGRTSRQGNVGKTKYFMSFDDDLVRLRYSQGSLEGIRQAQKGTRERITSKPLIKFVKRCQEREEILAKSRRSSNEKRDSKVFTAHKNSVYEKRKNVLEGDWKKLLTYVMQSYTMYVDNEFKRDSRLESIKESLGQFVDVDSCYDKNPNVFKENLKNAMKLKLRNAPGKPENRKAYIDALRKRMLEIIDEHWIEHMENLDQLFVSAIVGSSVGNDPEKKYEEESARMYADMFHSIQANIVLNALDPGLLLGQKMTQSAAQKEGEQIKR